MIARFARALAIVLGSLLLVGTAPRDAAAFGHSGGGHGGGGWHGGWGFGVGFGFGWHGCCWGGPWGYWPAYSPYPYAYPYAYPYPAYAPPVIAGGAAPAGYASAAPPGYINAASAGGAPTTLTPASASATITPPPAARGNCREYQSTVLIDGRQQRAFGTVCRQPDGSWRTSP